MQFQPAAAAGDDVVDAAAFFGHFGAAPVGGIEDETVAGLEGGDAAAGQWFDDDAIGQHAADAGDVEAAMVGGAATDDGLVVGAGDEVGSQPAGIDLGELLLPGRGDGEGATGPGVVDGLAVGAGGEGDVVGIFVAPFNLQGGDAKLDDFGHLLQGVEVAGGEEVAGVAQGVQAVVDEEVVGQAAGLGALAAVGAAAAPRFRAEALAGVGDAQRAVDKHL